MTRRWSQLLVDAIDPVLAESPFQAGQTGEPPTDDVAGWTRPGASVIWCGGYEDVIEAHPHLACPEFEAEEDGCFDVTVNIDDGGHLSTVWLEHWDLPEVLESMGRTGDAAAAVALVGRPAEEAVPELAALLARLFPPADPSPVART